jgi:acyl-CoA thioester hydrolase
MPLTLVRTFRVRYHECDALGRVHHANYLRYMQEAAFDASAAAGYDMARYTAMGCHWLIRETNLKVLAALRYGDSVQVKTWVADFRRVRSRRAYELRLTGSDELVAQAYTDWVFLDQNTGRPVAIPEEMVAAFYPEGLPDSVPPREHLPDAPPPPPGVFCTRRRVDWRDLDAVGHVNNAVYLAYVEDSAVQAAAAHGWSPQHLAAEGLSIQARQHRIEYRQPAMLNDELEIATWLSDVKPSSLVRHYTLTRMQDGALVSQARTLWGIGDLASGAVLPMPDALLADLAPNVSSTQDAVLLEP